MTIRNENQAEEVQKMTKQEFGVFAMALRTYYSREDKLLANPQAMELWFRQLKDIPYDVAELALNKWVALNKWSPSIADIREMSASVTTKTESDWGEGWEQVQKAIRKYGYYEAEKAIESMDDVTRACVRRIGFQNICLSENLSVERASFRIIYEQLAEREKKEKLLPAGLTKAISQMQDGKVLRIETQ